ncbi:MAG: leader peptidase (prepilin peptidase)/N-methyltransferase [Pseudohongiellaceae bacterium]|jgi:leader peptidase (prepilin peptidase)/N-methyltransferase
MIESMTSNLELLSGLPLFYYSFIFIFSLLVGSFLNVVILRIPKILQQSYKDECIEILELTELTKNNQDKPIELPDQQEKISLSYPPSTCPKCHTKIKPWHNIPIISYFLLLKGRCYSCGNPISLRYPLIELITALLSVLTIYLLGFSGTGLLALLLLWTLTALTMIDVDTFLLPDDLTLPLLWLGLIINSFGVYTDLSSALWGAIVGYSSLWSVFWLFKLVTGKDGMGYGDFKLLAALGAWMGWQFIPLIVILSSFVGAVIGIAGILILGRDKNIPIPFGPYLAIAGWISFLWGEQLINYYLTSIL